MNQCRDSFIQTSGAPGEARGEGIKEKGNGDGRERGGKGTDYPRERKGKGKYEIREESVEEKVGKKKREKG